MKRWKKIVVGVLALLIGVAIMVVVVVHLPEVQNRAFAKVSDMVFEATGLRIAADEVSFQAISPSFSAQNIVVDAESGRLMTIDRVSARWSWRDVFGSPPRIDSLVIKNPLVDLTKLPPSQEDSAEPQTAYEDLFGIVEIGKLELSGGRIGQSTDIIDWNLSEIAAQVALEGGVVRLEALVGAVDVIYEGRPASFGTVALHAEADAAGIHVERLKVDGAMAGLQISGSHTIADAMSLVDFAADCDLAGLVHWLQPEFEDRLRVNGRLVLNGHLRYQPGAPLEVEIDNSGPSFSVAGFSVDDVRVRSLEDDLTVDIAGRSWGHVHALLEGTESLEISAQFDGVPFDHVAALGEQALPPTIPKDLRLSGTIATRFDLPFDMNALSINADMQARWSQGRAEFLVVGGPGDIDVSKLLLVIPGAEIRGHGSLRDQDIMAALGIAIANPRSTAEFFAQWAPQPVIIAGGPIIGSIKLDGTISEPRFETSFDWGTPRLDEIELELFHLEAIGGKESADWKAEVEFGGGSKAQARGRTQFRTTDSEGSWNLVIEELAQVIALAPADARVDVAGAVVSEGRFVWENSAFLVDGNVSASNIVAQGIVIGAASFDFAARSDGVNIRGLEVSAFGGSLGGDINFGFGLDDPLAADLKVTELDLEMLGLDLPPEVSGVVDVEAHVRGTAARPVADTTLAWKNRQLSGVISELEVQASLADGTLQFVSRSLESAAGSLLFKGQAPLGDMPRPSWLWPDAPGGGIEIDLNGVGLRPAPLINALGIELNSVELGCDLELNVRWDLLDVQKRIVDLKLDNVSIDGDLERLVSSGPIRANLRGSQIVVESLKLVGEQSRIEAEGRFDLLSKLVEAHCDAVIDETFADLVPLPVRIYGPLKLTLDFSGPLDQMAGEVRVDHAGGAIIMRDPPFEVKDLWLDIEVNRGIISIRDGRASVNRGIVEFGGGWNPAVGQGIILDLTDVAMLLPMDILTRWDGTIAIEPAKDNQINVGGYLELDGGYWDQPFNYSGVILGSGDRGLAADDPLHDINLDLEIIGRNGISVRNNLGSFDVVWNKIRIGGTAASPLIDGELQIPYGGVLTVGSGPIKVQRATVELVGDPNAPPRIEIVPIANTASSRGSGQAGEGGGFDATVAVTNALARSIGSALGLENEEIHPAEIAVETETNPGQQFAIGQRLSRNIALILTTNLSDVQDRTTMLQLWNFSAIPGLALQAFQETKDNVAGFAVFERKTWGGTLADDERPRVHKIKLKGDWPVSKWKLKRASGVRQGQAYDPFLLFAVGVRLEKELAGYGYHEARVSAEATGESRLPAMEFTCNPGPMQPVVFSGQSLPKKVRRLTTALYAPPPLDEAAMENMRTFVEGHLDIKGYPDAMVSVSRNAEDVEVHVERALKRLIVGPKIGGLPQDVAMFLEGVLADPSEMAGAFEDSDRVEMIVRRQLISRGYYNVESVHVWGEALNEKTELLHIDVEPGKRANIDAVTCLGNDPLGAFEKIRSATGKPLDRWEIDRSVIAIRRTYQDAGYSDADVNLELTKSDDERWTVVVTLDPGVQRRFSKVVFEGNRFISEKVLRSGLLFAEGDVFDPTAVDLSAHQIAVFAPVEHLEVHTRPEGVDGTVVEFGITEKPRWALGLGLRHRSDRGFEALFDVGDHNLFGRGFGVNLRGRWGKDNNATFLVLNLPKRPGGRVDYSLVTSYEEGDVEREFDYQDLQREQIKSISGQAAFELDASSLIRTYLTWQSTRTFLAEQSEYFPIDETIDQITPGLVYIRDRFDNPFDPRKGYYLSSDLSYTTELTEGEHQNIRNLLTGSLALEPFAGWTWRQSLRLGIADPLGGTLPATDRFYAGGQASVRGFETNSVGPLIDVGSSVIYEGGGALFILNEEIAIPIWDALRVAIFADIGQVWEDWSSVDTNFSIGLGVGLRYATPIGPVYGDIAWPVANRGVSSGMKYYLGIGKTF